MEILSIEILICENSYYFTTPAITKDIENNEIRSPSDLKARSCLESLLKSRYAHFCSLIWKSRYHV